MRSVCHAVILASVAAARNVCGARESIQTRANIRENLPRRYWGDYPPGKYDFLKVIGEKHWAVKLTHFGVVHHHVAKQSKTSSKSFLQKQNSPMAISCGGFKGCAAVVDSGTSVLAVPREQLGELSDVLHIARDCSNFDSLPSLYFRMGVEGEERSVEFEVPPRSYVRKIEASEAAGGSPVCMPLFVVTPLGPDASHGPVWILGAPFMREYRVMYDRDRREVGFAQNEPDADCPDLSSGSDPGLVSKKAGSSQEKKLQLLAGDAAAKLTSGAAKKIALGHGSAAMHRRRVSAGWTGKDHFVSERAYLRAGSEL